MIAGIVKTRRLPAPGRILVQVGDLVGADTPVGIVDYIPGPLSRVNVAEAIGVHRDHLDEVLLKQAGDWVEAGEVIAVSDEFYIDRAVTSPRPGQIGLVSRTLGHVYIREPLPVGAREPVVVKAADAGWTPIAFANNLLVETGDLVEFRQTLVSGRIAFSDITRAKATKRQPIESPIHGRVTGISIRDCTIVIKPLRHATEVLAHIAGRVAAVDPSGSVEIATDAEVMQGIIGYGGERVGGLVLPPRGEARDIDVPDLPTTLADKVIVGRCGISAEALQRCIAGGAAGVVLGSARRPVLRDALGADPVQVIGALAETATPVILMNGFGALPMAAETYANLVRLSGELASLDGSTQLRAGVVRPEIIVPVAAGELGEARV